VKFEPRATSELVGWRLLTFAVLGSLVLIMMAVRAIKIIRSTRLVRASWSRRSEKLCLENTDVPVYCLDVSGSVLAVLGFLRPKIFVTRQVVEILTRAELLAAVEHERAHITSFDNLKQLVLKVTRIPYWLRVSGGADSAWTNASEIAADETALTSGASVLDLSAALIKVAALSSQRLVSDNVAASHLVLVESGTSLQARVDHLQEILEGGDPARCMPTRNRGRAIIVPLALVVIAYVTCVNAVLPWVHEALEALMR
jgi:beta-lactamase regulating signal transducer with metallopeptidase domain